MLIISIPETELYDEIKNEFFHIKGQKLVLEHSLVSLSKWESKWKKPFFDKKPKTTEESIDYIRCMTVNSVDPMVYLGINQLHMKMVNDYIEDPKHAATINQKNAPSR